MEIVGRIFCWTILQVKNKLIAVSCISLIFLMAGKHSSAQESITEYHVKAVFLYNFSQFVIWPDSCYTSKNSPFVIGILGNDPFGYYIDNIVNGEFVYGHPIIVQRLRRIDEANNCHILYFGDKNSDRLQKLIARIDAKYILSVSDVDEFTKMGGMVEFATVENKIKIKINHEAVKKAGLEVSPKLLSLAEIVRFENQ
jgi:hypothetical protein